MSFAITTAAPPLVAVRFQIRFAIQTPGWRIGAENTFEAIIGPLQQEVQRVVNWLKNLPGRLFDLAFRQAVPVC